MTTALSTWGLSLESWPCPRPCHLPLSLLALELIIGDLLLSQDHAIVPGQQQHHAQQENLHGGASSVSGVLAGLLGKKEQNNMVRGRQLMRFLQPASAPGERRGSGIGPGALVSPLLLLQFIPSNLG